MTHPAINTVAQLRGRTEPLRICVDVDEVFDRFGLLDMADAESDALSGDAGAIGRLLGEDLRDYEQAYATVVRDELAARGYSLAVEIWNDINMDLAGIAGDEGILIDELRAAAEERAPLPMTGIAPDHSDGTPADAVRRAGRTYLERTIAMPPDVAG